MEVRKSQLQRRTVYHCAEEHKLESPVGLVFNPTSTTDQLDKLFHLRFILPICKNLGVNSSYIAG